MTTLLALARLWGADVTAVTVESALDVSDAIAPIAANDIGARLPGTERGATSTVIALPAAVVPPTPEPPTGMFAWNKTGWVVPAAVNATRYVPLATFAYELVSGYDCPAIVGEPDRAADPRGTIHASSAVVADGSSPGASCQVRTATWPATLAGGASI